MIIKKPLTEKEYFNFAAPVLFNDEQSDRQFMSIDTCVGFLKFGWSSDLVQPLVTEIGQDLICVGVDLHFVIYSNSLNRVVVSLALDSFFCTINFFNGVLFVAAETELYEINITLFSVNKLALPDIFTGFVIDNKKLQVCFMNGDSMTLCEE